MVYKQDLIFDVSETNQREQSIILELFFSRKILPTKWRHGLRTLLVIPAIAILSEFIVKLQR